MSTPQDRAILNGFMPASPMHEHAGLTKREEIASRALAGLLANSHPDAWAKGTNEMAGVAVEHADALLYQLELSK